MSVDQALAEALRPIIREELERALDGVQAGSSPWVDVAGAAAYCVMSPEAIRGALKRGQLKAHRSETGRLRLHRSDLDAFLTGGEA